MLLKRFYTQCFTTDVCYYIVELEFRGWKDFCALDEIMWNVFPVCKRNKNGNSPSSYLRKDCYEAVYQQVDNTFIVRNRQNHSS